MSGELGEQLEAGADRHPHESDQLVCELALHLPTELCDDMLHRVDGDPIAARQGSGSEPSLQDDVRGGKHLQTDANLVERLGIHAPECTERRAAGGVKERPILFSAPMVRALLDGSKTQTRRVVKGGDRWRAPSGPAILCPYGVPGDRLWVRETFCEVFDAQYGEKDWFDYRATPRYSEVAPAGWENEPSKDRALKWTPSIHMPRRASRINLEVTDVRVERLQDIIAQDAIAEGITLHPDHHHRPSTSNYGPVQTYRDLWEDINGAGSWDLNPWVWAISFRRL